MPKPNETKPDEKQDEKPLSVGDELRAQFKAADDDAKAADDTKETTAATDDTPASDDTGTPADDGSAGADTDDTKTDDTDTDDTTTEETKPDEAATDETETEAAAEAEGADTEPAAVELPEHFSEEDRKVFDGLDATQQKWLLGRHTSMEADYTRKTQELSEFRKTYEPVEAALAGHKQLMVLNGLTPGQLVARWAQAEANLQQRPLEAIRWLAGAYNVSLEDALAAPEDQDLVDPEIQALRKDVANLRSSLDQRSSADTELMVQNQATMIKQFQDARNQTTGDLLHPHAKNDAVLTKMVQLAGADRAVGKTPDLEDLYTTAVQLVPSVAAQVQAAATRETDAANRKEAAKKAARAKKAGKSVTGSPASKTETALEDLPLREQLRRQLDPSALH